jgi:hypothetical protein
MAKNGGWQKERNKSCSVLISLSFSTHNMHASKQKRGDENFMRELNHIKCDGMGILCKAQAESLRSARQRTKIPRSGISRENYREIFQDASSAQEPAITRYVCNTFQKVLLPGKYQMIRPF